MSKVFGFPPSFAQERLWFLDQLEPGNASYNLSIAIRFTGRLNVAALAQSLNEIVRRHEALRTTIAVMDGQPVQVIAPTLNLTLPVVDLRAAPETGREAEAQRLIAEEARHPFDLARGPLLRTALLQLGEDVHVLLHTVHHIVFDDWSGGVFFRELSTLYVAFSAGKPSPLAELTIQYADFAVWQRQWLQGEVLEAQLGYWKRQLEEAPAILQLPTDRPRPAVQTFRGAQRASTLSKTLVEALKVLSRRKGATLFMTLLAAFKALLYRYTGQTDIVVGSPIANRNQTEIEELIGFFVNTLVMRTDLSGNPTFDDLLSRAREATLEAYAHQDLPFEKLVEELQPERNLSYSPLFQVMFALQNAPTESLELPRLTLRSMAVDRETAQFDLALSMRDTGQGLEGSLAYHTDLFDAGTMTRMLRHFQTLLEGIVAQPDQCISALPLLTDAERQQMLATWNDTQTEYPTDKCIHELFETQVERTPDAAAVVFEDRLLTYRLLNRRANQLAHYLQRLGVGPEVLVALCVERSPEMVVGILGVLKAGGAYVPLDPSYPQERLAFALEDTRAPVLLTQQRLAPDQPEHGRRIVCLDSDWQTIARESQDSPPGEVTPDNLAYVIYTSGSTGRPKGVLVAHRGLPNVSEAQIRTFDLKPGDRVLQFASLSFDASVAETLMALGTGATLCPATQENLLPGADMIRRLRDWKVTFFTLTPSALAALPAEELPALRTVTVAGEACPAELVARWAEGRRFFNLYGPTEATIWTTVAECAAGNRKPPIGHPIANTQLYLLDAHLQPVPVGVTGELHVGGVGLTRGYLNRPELTAERFAPNPFGAEQGARLYKTGDLARYLPDGSVEFLGRADYQVKVRGFRVELGEIEAVLGGHPAVRETVVVAWQDESGDKRLVAYVVPQREGAPVAVELRDFLRERLPEYMAPSVFVTLEALPMTPGGKVDRRALPAPDGVRPELAASFVAPGTPAERVLADIWTEVLGIERIGIHDNFFELGGHSLLATQVVSRVRDRFEVDLPVRSLFESPTIAGVALQVERALIAQIKALGEEEIDRLLDD